MDKVRANPGCLSDTQRLRRIVAQVRKWNLAVLRHTPSQVSLTDLSLVEFADARSGVRGGRFRHLRRYYLSICDMMTLAEMVKPFSIRSHERRPKN